MNRAGADDAKQAAIRSLQNLADGFARIHDRIHHRLVDRQFAFEQAWCYQRQRRNYVQILNSFDSHGPIVLAESHGGVKRARIDGSCAGGEREGDDYE